MADVLVLNTPDEGRLRPKHVEWLCRNKTCTVLHQVGVSFDSVFPLHSRPSFGFIQRNGRNGPNKEMWWLTCNDNTCTSGRCTSSNTPDDGRLRPKHVEWLCRNKTCTVLHQVGVSFDVYYDARKHKRKYGALLNRKRSSEYLYNVDSKVVKAVHTNGKLSWLGKLE